MGLEGSSVPVWLLELIGRLSLPAVFSAIINISKRNFPVSQMGSVSRSVVTDSL